MFIVMSRQAKDGQTRQSYALIDKTQSVMLS